MDYYFILTDREFEEAAAEVSAYCTQLEQGLDQYSSAVTSVATTSIPSGEVHDALLLYIDYVEKLKTISTGIGEKFSRIVQSFIQDVEEADSYLYVAGVSSTRDFSAEEYEHLRACLDDPWCSLTDSFGDWVYSKILKVVDFFNLDAIKQFLHKCHRLLLDYNNETLAGLNALFSDVHSIDNKYGASVAGAACNDYYTSRFAYAISALCGVRDMMNEMAAMVEPGKGAFTPTAISSRLSGKYTEMLDYFEKFIGVPERGHQATVEEISDFVSQPWATRYFSGFSTATLMFVAGVGGLEAALMILFQMFDITKDTAIQGNYESYLTKKQLLGLLEDMTVDGLYSGSEHQERVDEMKTYLKYFKKYGEEGYKYLNTHRYGEEGKKILDGRTVEARKYREFTDGLGNAKKILSYGDEGLDYLSRLLADYSQGLEVIESFEANCEGNPEMLKTVQEIKALYNKEFLAWGDEAYKKIEEVGYDFAIKELGDATPVMAVVNAIDMGIDVVGDVSGLGADAKSTYSALSHFNMSTTTNDAFISAVEKLRAADPTSEEYSALATDVKNCFALHKNTMVEMFNNMAAASDGTEKSYYRYCASRANSLTLNEYREPGILTYDEYLKAYAS